MELHLDRIFPHRDIVAMKTNNICSYTDVLVACMRQNPIWILLSEVRSGEAVMSIRNAISSGHNILSTIHADKASSIPMRMYSLMESSQDVTQFLTTIHRYVQLGVYVKGYFSKKFNRFQREIIEVCEFYVDDNNKPCTNEIYKKALDGHYSLKNPTQHLLDYLSIQNVMLDKDTFHIGDNPEYDGDIEADLKKYHEEEAAMQSSSGDNTNNFNASNNATSSSNVAPASSGSNNSAVQSNNGTNESNLATSILNANTLENNNLNQNQGSSNGSLNNTNDLNPFGSNSQINMASQINPMNQFSQPSPNNQTTQGFPTGQTMQGSQPVQGSPIPNQNTINNNSNFMAANNLNGSLNNYQSNQTAQPIPRPLNNEEVL